MSVYSVSYLYFVYSVKPVVEKAPLVIPLIQQNRWLNARKPEDLEADDSDNRENKSEKVAVVQQTGDRVTDAAVQEILGTVSILSSVESLAYICIVQ